MENDVKEVLDASMKRFQSTGREPADNIDRQAAAFFLFEAAMKWKKSGNGIDAELETVLKSALQDACEFDVCFLYEDINDRAVPPEKGKDPAAVLLQAIQGKLNDEGLEADRRMIEDFRRINIFIGEFAKEHSEEEVLENQAGWLDSMLDELVDLEVYLAEAERAAEK